MDPLRRAFRGYEPAQVDALTSELRARSEGLEREIQVLRAENQRLSDELATARAKAAELAAGEEAVKNALVSAHRQADEVLESSRKEAEVLLQVARETGARLQEDLRGRIDDLNWQIERLSLQKQNFLNGFRKLLEGHLAELVEGPAKAERERSEAGSLAVEMSESSESLSGEDPLVGTPLHEPSVEFKS